MLYETKFNEKYKNLRESVLLVRLFVCRACRGEVPMLFIGTKTGQSKANDYAKQTQFPKG
jgi:hypothetical protein